MTNPNDSLPVVKINVKDQRGMNMALARLGGATYKQIGEEWGLSKQRVQQILTQMELDNTEFPRFGMASSDRPPPYPVSWPRENTCKERRIYFGPGQPMFRQHFKTFKGQIGKANRRTDVQVLRELRDKLGRLPYPSEVAWERYPELGKKGGPVVASHWVSRKYRKGKNSYTRYRDRMYIAAFGWGTKAPDGRTFLAALAQQAKEQNHG